MNKQLHVFSVLVAGGLLVAACEPTIKIEAPDKPIVLQIDLNIKQEVLLRVEKDVEGVSVTPAIPLAKRGGWIGERPDGYLGLVRDDAPAEIKGLVSTANESRLSRYDTIAKKHNTVRETVESVAGRKFIQRSAPGEYIMTADSTWVKK
ncbi:MAG: YnbE family lipoprotein [Rhodospirillales bacterium]|nr:YnbE family lipoprotein [Rhodospirillales bacterium]